MSILDIAVSLEITGKLNNAREGVIMIMGEDKFKEKVDGFRPILAGVCDSKGISEIEGAIEILKMVEGREVETILAMAACAEIIEPRAKAL
ncbi:MAG: hypothetical protein GY941_15710 [Planctomycetes bacterium]|nr:hypothetical protein [Planctomycetota bacterium]